MDTSKLGISNQLIIKEALKRGWQAEIIDNDVGIIKITNPSGVELFLQSVVSKFNPMIGAKIADNKTVAQKIALEQGLTVPASQKISAKDNEFLKKYETIVVKPTDGAHGHGVTLNITKENELTSAIEHAKTFSSTIQLQQQVTGEDIRLFFIGGKFHAASHRKPASVTGDGKLSLNELIEKENNREERGHNYQTPLNVIDLDASKLFLGDRMNTEIPEDGEEVQVVGTANIGTGGTAFDITDEISQNVIEASKKFFDVTSIAVGGIDFIASEDHESENLESFYFIEANAAPSLGLHELPHFGKSRQVTAAYIDWLESNI